ncbi:DUF5666 domain-containing protein [Variovorax sp. J22P168]|uniref:DUF5666 domain-containing protein n=1 Tax=Variovorax jilinensis TaxID=3053513 RepID=UPI002574FE2E|nr:DUF5666 domain-containing protein [Variovorax sp. J22P168]MDM0015481.1 DUF5666 domain-containing protein [Variovorax sp. J22P168]
MNKHVLGTGLIALTVALLLSCGGGGGGGAVFAPGATGAGGNGAGPAPTAAAATNAAGDSGGGLGGIAADDASASTTTAASGGDDGSGGVGSGGTGVSTADATSVGAVDGAGSIIVNGLRYDTSRTTSNVQDAPAGLQLGMTARVTGPVSADFTSGIALRVDSAADLRGPLVSVDLQQGSFVVLGTTVTTDAATVWADAFGLAALPPGDTVQVWGLPGASGTLRATRVERHAQGALIVTGTVQGLDVAAQGFALGGLVVDFANLVRAGAVDVQTLANGTLVRVRADNVSQGRLVATSVELWYPVPRTEGTTVQVAGLVTEFAGLASLRVLGLEVDASAARITGGPADSIGNGVKVEVGGRMTNGILKASKLKLRHVPGTGGPASFDLIGTVGAFRSAADFRVKGQPIDASGAGVTYRNGTAANLGNGVKVHVHGSAVLNGVLTADLVEFQ